MPMPKGHRYEVSRRYNLTCHWCKEAFEARHWDAKYCQPACRLRAHRARKKAEKGRGKP